MPKIQRSRDNTGYIPNPDQKSSEHKYVNEGRRKGYHHCPKCEHDTYVDYSWNHRCVKCGYVPRLDIYNERIHPEILVEVDRYRVRS